MEASATSSDDRHKGSDFDFGKAQRSRQIAATDVQLAFDRDTFVDG